MTPTRHRARTLRPLLALLTGAAVTLALPIATRPRPVGAVRANGPDSPPSAPITVHVDAHGRLRTDARRAEPDPPIVRTPDTRPTTTATATATATGRADTIRRTTTTIAPSTTTTPSTTPTPTTPASTPAHRSRVSPPPDRPVAAAPSPTPVSATAGVSVHVVVPGDNLWQIARGEVARVSGSDRIDDAQVAPYWQRVIAANRSTLRSGDPSLIFPGEVVTLP